MDTVHELSDDHAALAAELAGRGVKYAVGGWIDITGRSKSKIVPIAHLPNLLAGSERYTPRGMGDLGRMTPTEDECIAVPDADPLIVMPWDTRFVWMAADLSFGGREPFAHCTRSILKKQLDEAAELGYMLNLGVEPELYVFKPESLERADGYLEPMARSAKLKPTQAYD